MRDGLCARWAARAVGCKRDGLHERWAACAVGCVRDGLHALWAACVLGCMRARPASDVTCCDADAGLATPRQSLRLRTEWEAQARRHARDTRQSARILRSTTALPDDGFGAQRGCGPAGVRGCVRPRSGARVPGPFARARVWVRHWHVSCLHICVPKSERGYHPAGRGAARSDVRAWEGHAERRGELTARAASTLRYCRRRCNRCRHRCLHRCRRQSR